LLLALLLPLLILLFTLLLLALLALPFLLCTILLLLIRVLSWLLLWFGLGVLFRPGLLCRLRQSFVLLLLLCDQNTGSKKHGQDGYRDSSDAFHSVTSTQGLGCHSTVCGSVVSALLSQRSLCHCQI
jgi:hypothetical protein